MPTAHVTHRADPRYLLTLVLFAIPMTILSAELNATDVHLVSDHVKFIDMVGNFDRERFLEAAYWAGSAFNVEKFPKILVIRVNKDAAEFVCPNAPLRTCLDQGVNTAGEPLYELWVGEEPTDAVLMSGLANILKRERGLDTEQAMVLGNRALKQLQATVSVKQEKR